MIYTSAVTKKGNSSTSKTSQEDADMKAEHLDSSNCSNCFNCSDCSNCFNCSDCSNCRYCSNCSDCSNCYHCSNCRYCSNCHNCSHCFNCSDCSNCHNCSNCRYCSNCYHCSNCSNCYHCSNCLRWNGPKANDLVSIAGFVFPVSISKDHMQIGCQNAPHAVWASRSDADIDGIQSGMSKEWNKYRDALLTLCRLRAERR